TIASITFQNFFKLYNKLAGMTGTAMTEAKEFLSTYGLDVVSIPTNRPLLRKNWTDLIYGSEKEKYDAIVEHVATIHGMGRPLLIGTISIERSEVLSELLQRRGIPHDVLNAKQHAREAQIVAKAGEFGRVTIATNMAGRGTDIKLGKIGLEELLEYWQTWKLAPKEASADLPEEELERLCVLRWAEIWLQDELQKGGEHSIAEYKELLQKRWHEEGLHPLSITDSVATLGGLHVVGTERHEARRIDNQLRGRCARQGDPGSSRFFLSLDDDIMRIFAADKTKSLLRYIGLSNGMPLEHSMVANAIERAQRKVEERNFEIRKNLLDYDGVMNEQRMIIYDRRQTWLEERDLRETMLDYIDETLEARIMEFADPEKRSEEWNLPELCVWLRETLLVEMTPAELKTIVEKQQEALLDAINKRVQQAYAQKEQEIGEAQQREMEKYLLLQTLDRKWMDHLYAMDLLREGINLRSYAGQDPKLIYKREGYEMFQELWDTLREEVISIIMKIRPAKEEEPMELEEAEVGAEVHGDFSAYEAAQERAGANAGEVHHEPIVRSEKKVSRNDPCPCGSGKKYKKCCGR
ncbi:MAG: SEC-C domain-containing protein, partial [Planctomycetes bacterium]|nr:SEC-C domain-containing protein [Planctomycetota bacterium]